MKIGIVTFHWATNYGAVLQAYALQTYLENSGYQVEIINYVPFRNKFVTTISRLLKRNFSYFKTEKKINYFRKKYLHLSKKYSFISSLKDTKDKYNCAIAGSDQIWNVSFTLQKGKKPNLTYFLSFLDDNVKKISYAASFGTECVPNEYVEISKPCLEKFQCLSVREMSGVQILNKIGFDAELVCDPTLLINSQEYQKIMQNDFRKKEGLFSFVLHNDENSQKIVSSVLELTGLSHEMSNSLLSVSEWLCCIRDSSLVVSNSFHCIMFSLIFKIEKSHDTQNPDPRHGERHEGGKGDFQSAEGEEQEEEHDEAADVEHVVEIAGKGVHHALDDRRVGEGEDIRVDVVELLLHCFPMVFLYC